jgi:hypothetical protein
MPERFPKPKCYVLIAYAPALLSIETRLGSSTISLKIVKMD